MSAPSTAYFPIDFKFRGSNNVEMTVNPAKAQADKATLMARFYLDDVICFQANVGGVLYHGFWGVVLPSGFNYNHHKTTRLLEINGPKPGQVLRTFNDAGLNTLGDADITDNAIIAFANYIVFPVLFKSAFYLSSSNHGFQVRKQGVSTWITLNLGSLSANTEVSGNRAVVLTGTPYEDGDLIEIRPFIVNDEGTYNGESIFETVQENINNYSANFRGTTPCTSGSNVTVLIKETDYTWLQSFSNTSDIATGRFIYSSINSAGTLVAAAQGHYQGLISGNLNRIVNINANGEIRNVVNCTEPITEPLVATINRLLSAPGQPVLWRVVITVNRTPKFTSAITVSGIITEKTPGGGDIQTLAFDVTIAANANSGVSDENYELFSSANSFVVTSATASPTTVDGVTLNPVKII